MPIRVYGRAFYWRADRCAGASAAIDVAFMPVDEERKKRLEFGPAYCLVESTYMVTAASGIRTLAEVDRPGVHVSSASPTRRRSAPPAAR